MAEAEDVLVDVAHHATVYAQDLWRRHRPSHANTPSFRLNDVAQRISLLLTAVFGNAPPLRAAQPPPSPTLLQTLFRRHEQPLSQQALAATDGDTIWLPAELPVPSTHTALERYRILALQQAMRATRGGAHPLPSTATALERDLYLLLEAIAADAALARLLPGLVQGLNALRRDALAQRPAPERFAAGRQGLEALLCSILRTDCRTAPPDLSIAFSPAEAWRQAQSLAARSDPALQRIRHPLCKDLWTGEFKCPPSPSNAMDARSTDLAEKSDKAPRSARLARRPEVREAAEDEDDQRTGPWMVQTAQPQEHAEDPIGMQRPTDRDESTAAEDFADSLSELPEARLVSTPGQPKEVLLSDDPLPSRTRTAAAATPGDAATFTYPEWDYRIGAYREPGARVHLLPASQGSPQWVAATLAEHRAMLDAIRRRFEMLRADRVRLRKQIDGADIDLDAYIDSRADFHAGRPMAQGLYQTWRASRRDMAIALLIDVSGSTDAWVSANRRVIDVEREALLLVCIALEGMNEPFAVHAFSGEGPDKVTVRSIKDFDEHHSDEVAQRIAALEPEHYTRAGAALRHVTASLMRQSARHRLLLLLSDGKPNDVDDYEGRYGVEDMRQAVTEAKLQGIFPFCLTIDRQAANYLPQVFGAHQYALLPRPELLPTVLLDWLKRLVAE
ncbi:nitric oxide reductase activation protein NorD [Noviherbaspirillum sp.]|uniref:nitric oxide reductase activation protein NorD n=1 Tax=Noviherbaspirillum sp. TaxID=1926288 RepID=UPI002B4A99C2|nr:VWA domain-containing protein [Noviherbaspirillum sp.]HJV83196.1 VWA domain-containing protein [Noviherbaspirillum sp.]